MMKKILTILLVCLLPLAAGAQTTVKKRSTAAKAATTATTKAGAKTTAKATAQTKAKKSTSKQAKASKATAGKSSGAFIVISKKDLNLRVYSKDSVLLAEYPACLSKNKGDKQRKLRSEHSE